jgi:hypothetical protein
MRASFYTVFIFVLALGIGGFSWSQSNYVIDAQLNIEEERMVVSQKIEFKNETSSPLQTLYFYDWANSYQGAPAPLASHLANEFNRSFYISANSKLGYTQINKIEGSLPIEQWSRLEDQLDIIKIELKESVAPGEQIFFQLDYIVKIPDDRFTGVGITSNKGVFLRDLFVSVAPMLNDQWLIHSNLGFRDYSSVPNHYKIKWTYPSTYQLVSNLNEIHKEIAAGEAVKISYFEDKNSSSPEFVFDLKDSFRVIEINDGFSIITDIAPPKNENFDEYKAIKQIDSFVKQILTPIENNKLLILKKDYSKNPIVGIGEALSFLKPFTEGFSFETKFLKTYLASYLNELLIINKRKDHWITGGIQTYILMKYVETYYPDSKFLGSLNQYKVLGKTPFNAFSATKIGFNESYSFIYEFSEHANRQQEDTLGKGQLTKSNELYTIPYHVGSGLSYLDSYLGDNILNNSIKEFSQSRGKKSLQEVLQKHTDKEINWFFDTYLTDREAYDLSINKVLKNKGMIRISVSEKNNKPLPYKLDLIKDDKIIKEQWIHHTGKDTLIDLRAGDADFIAINSNRFLPEKNRPNNWKYLQSASGFKPLQFTFYGDSENLARNQMFYHPISDFNIYDGFTAGMRLYNTRVKNQPFELDLHPQYSLKEDAFVGFFRTRYRFINHKSKNYLNQAILTGKSFHYNTNLRYTSIHPSFTMYFRPLDLRSNKRQLLNFSWHNVFRDKDPNIITNPDYSILSFLHRYENADAVNVFNTSSNLEVSDKFGKIYFSSQYRKLFPSGRQFSIRFFAGKFLWHNTTETPYFDFNLNRSPDYLFRYDYLGRSEDSGIYSQQFIPTEGGFKAFFEESSANNYMTSINASIGVWKWIEFYGDVGLLRNQSRAAVGYFDSGFKFNLVPDYFEIFFPLYSSNGFELTQSRYATKIRFIFTPRLKTLSNLFSRKWF